jgi:hypothetical protein
MPASIPRIPQSPRNSFRGFLLVFTHLNSHPVRARDAPGATPGIEKNPRNHPQNRDSSEILITAAHQAPQEVEASCAHDSSTSFR